MVNGERVCLECDTALTEGNTMSEEYKIGEINHGGAICPNCDHIVNLDGIKIPSEVDCPNCGTAMKPRPEKTVETANKLNNPESDSKTMTDSSAELKVEKTKTELEAEVANLHVEVANANSTLIEVTTKLRETERDRMNEANDFRTEIQSLTEKLATKTREVGTLTRVKNRVSELTEEVSRLETVENELSATVEGQQSIIESKAVRNKELLNEINELKTSYAGLRVQLDESRRERNDLSVRTKASEEKALNETRERSRIELDNANLLEKQRQLTSDISKLTERVSLSATQKLEQEKALAALLSENTKLKETHEAKLAEAIDTIEKAKKFHSWAWQQLKEAGVAVLQSEG